MIKLPVLKRDSSRHKGKGFMTEVISAWYGAGAIIVDLEEQKSHILKREEILIWLYGKVIPVRFQHSLETEAWVKKLSKLYGFSSEVERKASLAALLHDNAKMDVKDRYRVKSGKGHGYDGAESARNRFGDEVIDEEVYNAIRFHPGGREQMCKVEALVFIADNLASFTKPYEFIEKIMEKIYRENSSFEDLVEYVKELEEIYFRYKHGIKFHTSEG